MQLPAFRPIGPTATASLRPNANAFKLSPRRWRYWPRADSSRMIGGGEAVNGALRRYEFHETSHLQRQSSSKKIPVHWSLRHGRDRIPVGTCHGILLRGL